MARMLAIGDRRLSETSYKQMVRFHDREVFLAMRRAARRAGVSQNEFCAHAIKRAVLVAQRAERKELKHGNRFTLTANASGGVVFTQ